VALSFVIFILGIESEAGGAGTGTEGGEGRTKEMISRPNHL
jgi:hypothetical protein